MLEQDTDAQRAFFQLGTEMNISDNTIAAIQKYTCFMYGMKKLKDINDVRTQLFLDKYKPKKDADRISCVKKLDGSSLPPCYHVLLQKLKRTNFVANQWISSTRPHPPEMIPLDYGWKDRNGLYGMHWFEGDTSPKSLDIVCCEGRMFK